MTLEEMKKSIEQLRVGCLFEELALGPLHNTCLLERINMSKSLRYDPDADYTVANGVIANPGMFQGEPPWLPVLWDRLMNGFSDKSVHDGSMAIDGFRLDANLAVLTGHDPTPGSFLCIWRTEDGFVSHMVMTEQELDDCEGFDIGQGDYLDFQETDPFDGQDLGGF